jgi:hypothetical protein
MSAMLLTIKDLAVTDLGKKLPNRNDRVRVSVGMGGIVCDATRSCRGERN